jgi:signal transduction histidine kinase
MAASSVAGSGLGLSLVKSTVEAHGGEVTAQNRRDSDGRIEGARLTIRLPLNLHAVGDSGR